MAGPETGTPNIEIYTIFPFPSDAQRHDSPTPGELVLELQVEQLDLRLPDGYSEQGISADLQLPHSGTILDPLIK